MGALVGTSHLIAGSSPELLHNVDAELASGQQGASMDASAHERQAHLHEPKRPTLLAKQFAESGKQLTLDSSYPPLDSRFSKSESVMSNLQSEVEIDMTEYRALMISLTDQRR